MKRRQVGMKRQKRSEFGRLKTNIRTAGAFGITVVFALYHGFLGRFLSSIWHGSICAFYLLLAALRGLILLSAFLLTTKQVKNEEKRRDLRQKISFLTAGLLLLLNLALIVPITLMVQMQKPVNMGKIPAIAMAAYTTYKITMAIINTRKHNAQDMLIHQLTTINLVDALVSILTLQNTLIMVNSTPGEETGMLAVAASSSAIIYGLILGISLKLFLDVKRQKVHLAGDLLQ